MQISTEPADYQGVFAPVIYGITGAQPEFALDVTVFGATPQDVLGIKRFRGATDYSVNVANYLRRIVRFDPQKRAQVGFYVDHGRSVVSRIKADNTYSAQKVMTAGARNAAAYTMMSDAPQSVEIMPRDMDEISFIAPYVQVTAEIELTGANNNAKVPIAAFPSADKVCSLFIDMARLAEAVAADTPDEVARRYHTMTVSIMKDNIPFIKRRYNVVPEHKGCVRLCWVNDHGALDFYTFALCDSEKIAAHKSRIYTVEGYRVYDSFAERTYTLRSGYEPRSVIDWLCGVVCSPRVWMVRGEEFVPVDVITDEVTVRSGSPAALSLTLRESKKIFHQKF